MAEKGVARFGDTGSHGGTIINGASNITVNGRPMARVGDIYTCPIHGNNPIISGVTTIFGEGMLVAHVGSKTACGAVITSGSLDTIVDDGPSVVGENMDCFTSCEARPIATDGQSGSADFSEVRQITAGRQGNILVSTMFTQRMGKEVFDSIPDDQRKRLNKQFEQAMRESYVNTPQGMKMREQGGWIVKNPDGTYDLQRIHPSAPPTNNPNELRLRFPPEQMPKNAIGTFHTHPVPEEIIWPSEGDINLSKNLSLPGIIIGPNMKMKRYSVKLYDLNTPIDQ